MTSPYDIRNPIIRRPSGERVRFEDVSHGEIVYLDGHKGAYVREFWESDLFGDHRVLWPVVIPDSPRSVVSYRHDLKRKPLRIIQEREKSTLIRVASAVCATVGTMIDYTIQTVKEYRR